MTRQDAIKLIEKSLSVESLVDAWVALGMLKLDEPKTARDVLQDCVVSVKSYASESRTGLLDKYGVDALLHTLDLKGFKIVEK